MKVGFIIRLFWAIKNDSGKRMVLLSVAYPRFGKRI